MAYKHSTNAMKKLTFMMLLAAIFTLCVTSCSKDDDDILSPDSNTGNSTRYYIKYDVFRWRCFDFNEYYKIID